MPAHPVFEDLKPVQFTLDSEARRQLDELARAEKSNRSAIVRRLIEQAHVAFFRHRIHQNKEFTQDTPEPVGSGK